VSNSATSRRAPVKGARYRPRSVVMPVLRASGSTAALVAIYYLLPLDRTSTGLAIGMLVIGLVGLIGLVILQVRWIIKAANPTARAIEALATSAPIFLLLFAATYFLLGSISESNFTEPITRTDALYFTVTVFATVGFGDIAAKSELARVLVTGQMVADLVILGIGARIIVDAIKHGREQRPVLG
jgi:Ion channel